MLSPSLCSACVPSVKSSLERYHSLSVFKLGLMRLIRRPGWITNPYLLTPSHWLVIIFYRDYIPNLLQRRNTNQHCVTDIMCHRREQRWANRTLCMYWAYHKPTGVRNACRKVRENPNLPNTMVRWENWMTSELTYDKGRACHLIMRP